MNFEEFINTIKDTIKDYLPEEYKDAEVNLLENRKLNTHYTGLTVTRKGDTLAPTINLNALFENYGQQTENNLASVMEEVTSVIQHTPGKFDIGRVMDYDRVKKNLFMKLSAAEKNADVLEHTPHITKEDLALTFHIMLDQGEKGTATTMITDKMMDAYGVDLEKLYQDALHNSPVIAPAQIENMGEVLERMMLEDMKAAGAPAEVIQEMEKDLQETSRDNPMTVITNNRSTDGAAAIFYPGVMDQVGERLNGDYFILPSSVHEILVVPDDGNISFRELTDMVKEVNRTQVAPEDRLTDQVYHYDTADRIFEKAETFAERKKQKEAERGISADKAAGRLPRSEKRHKTAEMSL
ncbi:MAG TPA: hypothetical protein IAA05_14650 [Candidatus Blautia excrementipullorum]|nr:hypothetical protein [Candidatus Blautia excrementipullorum]